MLEFNKLVEQLDKMGSMLEKLKDEMDLNERMQLAIQRFDASGDLRDVWERISWVRESDVSGYRGAAPLDIPGAEPINRTVAPPEGPLPEAIVVAADGSQVYPDEQAAAHYYLLNIGLFVFYHGVDHTPEQITMPRLYYHQSDIHDRYGRIISNRLVDDRRTVREMEELARVAWERRDPQRPLVALYDNRLLFLPGADEADELLRDYQSAMVHLHDAGGILAGYGDNPFRSKRVIQLLYLMSLGSEDELKHKQDQLSRAGDLDGLRDVQFFNEVLKPGHRSAVMVQNSPQNYAFKERGVNYEIAFFYLKVNNGYQSRVVRVDIPVWVARDKQAVDTLHGVLLAQCRLQGRNPYPYALTRADELAVVQGRDRNKLEEMVNAQLRKHGIDPAVFSAKAWGKELARSGKRYFEMKERLE